MTNAVKGEFAVTVEPVEKGGPAETLTLVYDWDALVSLEDALDKGLIDILLMLTRGFRLGLVAPFFWAGLRRHHAGITLDQAKALIPRAGGPFELFEKIGAGIKLAFPTPDAEAGEAPADPQTAAADADGTPLIASAAG